MIRKTVFTIQEVAILVSVVSGLDHKGYGLEDAAIILKCKSAILGDRIRVIG